MVIALQSWELILYQRGLFVARDNVVQPHRTMYVMVTALQSWYNTWLIVRSFRCER
jgi:hypothetical protein